MALPPNRSPLRILLAEDTQINQTVAIRLLEQRGHSISVVSNGKEALGALQTTTFDLVLMDVQMPVMDGLVATTAIREKEKETGQHVPIIAMTASAMKGDRERCLTAGMDGYIPKPLRANELYQVVEQYATASDQGVDNHEIRPGPSDPLDLEKALDRMGGNRDTLKELVAIFFDECPTLLEQIRHAVAAHDPSELRRTAHALKSAVGVFAASPATEAAWRLESMAHDGNLQNVEEAWATLESEIERLKPALAELT